MGDFDHASPRYWVLRRHPQQGWAATGTSGVGLATGEVGWGGGLATESGGSGSPRRRGWRVG